MAERLNQLGIHCGQSRSAALFQLSTDLPAAVLAKMLGIHIAVAVSWQRASSGAGPPTPPRSAAAAAARGRLSRVPLLMPAIDRLWR
jgi:hypothetical protein